MFKKLYFLTCLILLVSVPVNATTYLDHPETMGNEPVNLANVPVEDVYYASMDIYTGSEPLWGGLSLYSDVNAMGDEMFLIGFDPDNIFGVRNKQGSDQFTDVADYLADETYHLILEVDRVNQTIKLWVDNDDFDTPDYAGAPEGGVSGSGNEFQAPLSVWCFMGLWGATGEYSNVLISDSAEDHFVLAAAPTAAMVVANTDLVAGFDQAQKDRLESLGYEVTVTTGDDVSDGAFTAADAETFDVLVVSESISSSAANNLIGANVPMMHQESYGWSRHFFTQGLNKVWLNDPDGMMDVVNDVHPIIADAGVSAGPVKFFNNPAASWTTDTVASLVPGAENLAQLTSEGEDYTLIFTIEAGTELADASLAANRIVGFSIPGNESFVAGDMTDEAWALFDAAIAWLDPAPVEIPAMVAHWTMDDVSGTVVTDSAGGNDGEIVGNVSWIDGVLGGAVTFDNSDPNAAIVIPHSEVLDFGDVDFSISMMVRYPVVPADAEHQLIMKGSFGSPDSGSRYTLFNKNGEFRFEIDNGPANVKSGIKIANAPVVTGEWVHVVLVRDAVNDLLSMYIDGVLMTSGADSSGDISSGEEMRIGNTTVGNGRTCEADIDDVRIFPSALTENEIAAIASLY